jgi:hypothetical protein
MKQGRFRIAVVIVILKPETAIENVVDSETSQQPLIAERQGISQIGNRERGATRYILTR